MFSTHKRVRSALFLTLVTLLAVSASLKQYDAAAVGTHAPTVAVIPATTGQEPESVFKKYSLSGKAPKGSWSVSAIPELGQATDTTTPVVVSGLSSLFGKKEWGGFLKVIGVKLTNRSPAAVAAVRLGWLIVTEQDRLALKPDAEAKQAEGATPLFETEIAARGAKKLDSPGIDFLEEAKPLLKKGMLNGEYVIKVRVVEVEFADGSHWREQDGAAKTGAANRPLGQS